MEEPELPLSFIPTPDDAPLTTRRGTAWRFQYVAHTLRFHRDRRRLSAAAYTLGFTWDAACRLWDEKATSCRKNGALVRP
jgi:hypothetical protein